MNQEFQDILEKNISYNYAQKGTMLTLSNNALLKFIDKQKNREEKYNLFYEIIDAHCMQNKGIKNIRKLSAEFSSRYQLTDNIYELYLKEFASKKYKKEDINRVLHGIDILFGECNFKIKELDLYSIYLFAIKADKEVIKSISPEHGYKIMNYLNNRLSLWSSFAENEQNSLLVDAVLCLPYENSQYLRKQINVLIKNADIKWLENNRSNNNLLLNCAVAEQEQIGSFIISQIKKDSEKNSIDTTELYIHIQAKTISSLIYSFIYKNIDLERLFKENVTQESKLNIEIMAEKRNMLFEFEKPVIDYYINNELSSPIITKAVNILCEKIQFFDEKEKIVLENTLLKKDLESRTLSSSVKSRL